MLQSANGEDRQTDTHTEILNALKINLYLMFIL